MITALDHIHIYARDPEHTLAFYQDAFGAERLGVLPGSNNHFLLLGGQFLVVSEFPDGMRPAEPAAVGDGARHVGFGVAHFGLQTSDLAATVRRLRDRGVHVHSEPRGDGAVRYVYVSAPDGVIVELVELHLPARLQRIKPLFDLYNRGIHASKRLFARRLFR